MREYSFEKLHCWQHARKLAVWIYKITATFPTEERFGLISQMRRSAVSIAANLAEGSSRKTAKDQAYFSMISYSSSIELLNHLQISADLEFITEDLYIEGRGIIEKQTLLISQLRKKQLAGS